MGDLQSPQYVKRTAHMFDSRFSSAERGNGGIERNGRNPSYLNVSRSVSGYSCLTYNNGSVTSENVSKTMLGNGTSLLSSGSRVSAATPRIKTDFAMHSPFSRTKVPNTDDDSSDHSSNQSATSPPPSLPPINSAATHHHGRFSDSSFFQNGMNRGEELIEDTPYIPSHGKSFVMQRIERLYGSDATNKGVVGRKSSSHVTTISISRESPPRGPERIIPIKVEPRERLQNPLYNTNIVTSKKIEINVEDREVNRTRNSSGLESTNLILPGIKSSSNDDHGRRVIEHRISRLSVENSDEEEDRVRSKQKSPTKLNSVSPVTISNTDNSGNLNGNANLYRNGVTVSVSSSTSNGKGFDSHTTTFDFDDRTNNIIPVKLEQVVTQTHANGSRINSEHSAELAVDEKVCTVLKKTLSRESSAESEGTNGCSEASLELASISDGESPKNSIGQDNSLYSNRGSVTSPDKPKPKPKPKDMALLRTLSRSPALKTGNENIDKTAISLSFVEPSGSGDSVIQLEDIISFEDVTDADGSPALTDIKNTIATAATEFVTPASKATSSPLPLSVQDQEIQPTDIASSNKENAPSTEKVFEKSEIVTSTSNVKDGNYFINEMNKVKDEILKFSEKAAKELDSLEPSSDRAGSIHAAIGKGNLLVKKKFKQFEELCHANLKGVTAGEPETTNEDLAGFWDMVMIQVDQIYSLFADLEKKEKPEEMPRTPSSKASSSPRRAPASTSKPKTNLGATPKANSAAAKARDEARRKMLAEKRKAMKSQMQETLETSATDIGQETEVQIFTPDTPHTG